MSWLHVFIAYLTLVYGVSATDACASASGADIPSDIRNDAVGLIQHRVADNVTAFPPECKTVNKYCRKAATCATRGACCEVLKNFPDRMGKLFEINDWIIAQPWWKAGVDEIIAANPGLAFNHVAPASYYSGNAVSEHLPSTAQVCAKDGKVGGAGKDDITKGIGYYHFNRINVGRYCSAPNFPLVAGKIMYVTCPSVLYTHSFIICSGNIAKRDDCPGKQEAGNLGKLDKVEKIAKDSLAYLSKMLQGDVPSANEIAFFGGVEFSHLNKIVTPDTTDASAISQVPNVERIQCDAQMSATCGR